MTLKESFSKALLSRRSRLVKQTFRYDVYTRVKGGIEQPGVFYYLGRAGALRVGTTVARSVPVQQEFKDMLVALANAPQVQAVAA